MYSWNVLSNEIPPWYFSTRFIRLKTEVEELVSQRKKRMAKRNEEIEESRLKRDISSF